MSRPAELGWALLAAMVMGLAVDAFPAWAGEDSRTALAFIEQLRERGLHDLAREYLNILRADPDQPANIKAILDYEEGRTLIDEAAKSGDLVLREDLLERGTRQARRVRQGASPAHRDARSPGAAGASS